MGRERPPFLPRLLAPGPSRGVAHAPHVAVIVRVECEPDLPCDVSQISRADDVEFIVSCVCTFAGGNSCTARRRGRRIPSGMAGRSARRNATPTVRRCRRSERDYAGALRRVKASLAPSLAPLAADAALTRPSRSLHRRRYRSDGRLGSRVPLRGLNPVRHATIRLVCGCQVAWRNSGASQGGKIYRISTLFGAIGSADRGTNISASGFTCLAEPPSRWRPARVRSRLTELAAPRRGLGSVQLALADRFTHRQHA